MCRPILRKRLLNFVDLIARVQLDKSIELFLNLGLAERPVPLGVVVVVEGNGAVLRVYGVDEARCLVVPEVGKCGDVEGGEHLVVFVDEVAAAARVSFGSACRCQRRLTGTCILRPTGRSERRHRSARSRPAT